VAVLTVLAAVLYLRYLRLPEGYVDPDTLPWDVLEARSADFRARAGELASHLASNEPFDVTVSDDAVNAYVATTLVRTGGAWLDEFRVPRSVEHVQVRFHPGFMTVYARVNRGWASCVLSAALVPRVSERGDLDVRVQRVRSGRLTLPPALVESFLGRATREPFVLHGAGRRARLSEVHLTAGTIRLVGRPS
jgi:hypothetical protein